MDVPVNARSRARRLLVANGITDFVREFPLTWNGVIYHYDFTFASRRTILRTVAAGTTTLATTSSTRKSGGRPGRLGHRIVFATWGKVTTRPEALRHELDDNARRVASAGDRSGDGST